MKLISNGALGYLCREDWHVHLAGSEFKQSCLRKFLVL